MQEPVIIKDFLSEDLRKYLSLVSKIYLRSNNIEFDIQDGANSCAHHDSWTDALAITSLKKLREITKKNLEPTYAYLRIYNKYAYLAEHIDRDSCEYSVTAFIDSCNTYDWPIKMDGKEYSIKPGEAILYKGCDWKHSRDEFLGDWHAQVFLHFVDMDGPKASSIYDGRKTLGIPKFPEFTIGKS
tara:strand:+ start:4161 stop:4715 length:555 start_codon:yes stop_codon:yes gene_type:complete